MRLKKVFVGLVLLGTIGCSNGQYAVTSSATQFLLVDTATGKAWRFRDMDRGFQAVKVDGLWTDSHEPVQ